MSIYTIADLHLSFNENKPMDIFGDNWKNHDEKIKQSWLENVKDNDLVVMPGDFSWAMYLKDTLADFDYLNKLPGEKIMLKGNHDYWWTTIKSMQEFLKQNNIDKINFLHNNSYEFEDCIIVGTRGWSKNEDAQDNEKIFNREALRLELSIKDGIEKYGEDKEIIAFTHYPTITQADIAKNEKSEFVRILQKYNIKRCYYGHLHASAIKDAVQGKHFGIEFNLVSADGRDFKLLKIK